MQGRPARVVRRIGAVVCAIVLGLVVAEQAASVVRSGAFPYLNIFRPDARLGVRLAPNAIARVSRPGGSVTTVETNALGLRGPDEPLARRAVLVLGDSQALGLHVEWTDTFAARLGHSMPVVDAAVPSWGPPEYQAILEELGPRVVPRYVVYVANVANDWQEAFAPNRLRTTARDGWAVRPSRSGSGPTDFPGRSWIFGRSHLAYATRQVAGRVSDAAPIPADAPRVLIDQLETLRRSQSSFRSRLGPSIAAAQASCAQLGCNLIVAVLPLDVQVHSREWTKYRHRPIDLRATEVLAHDLLADAEGLGIKSVDLLPVLRAASPGAFLPDDPHLSPRGHDAMARALGRLIEEETQP